MINHARPLDEVLRDEHVAPRVRELLTEVTRVKSFGEAQGLKPTTNYRDYVDLKRPYVVYVVSACDELSFKSKEWKFPVVGAFPYLGWFDLNGAKALHADLKKEGYDADLRGARAFSTLGWFRDPILSSMIVEGDEAMGELANTIIHESVHATVYVKGQATFNESIASFIADGLTPVFLSQTYGKDSARLEAYNSSQAKWLTRSKRFHQAYEDLDRLYRSNASDAEKREKKREYLAALKSELKIEREINNATLVQYKEYNSGFPGLEALLTACKSSYPALVRVLLSVQEEDFTSPQQASIDALVERLKERCR